MEIDEQALDVKKRRALAKWRLILGKKAENNGFQYDDTGALNFQDDETDDFIDQPVPGEPDGDDLEQEQGDQGEDEREATPESLKGPQTPVDSKKRSIDNIQDEAGQGRGSKPAEKARSPKGKPKPAPNRAGARSPGGSGKGDGRERQQARALGGARGTNGGGASTEGPRRDAGTLDRVLDMVYQPKHSPTAGTSSSGLSIPKWIEHVKELFPTQAKEMMEKDLIDKSDIKDLVKHPELFEKVEPSISMVQAIIQLKHLLPNDVKMVARKVIEKVVEDLKDKLKSEYEKHIVGALKRNMHTPLKVFKNIDWKQSLHRNLKNYNPKINKLIMAEPRFFSNERRKKPWQIIVLIDESGSMAASVIYSVVIASIFASLPAIHTNLVIFDTRVVDLSDKVHDPVDVLMSVQLGGGTDITKAVEYGRGLIKNAKKAIMILISDFYEGRHEADLLKALRSV
nr:VWA domain-containing protein [Candidatus Sigynarchaeota archaeon]